MLQDWRWKKPGDHLGFVRYYLLTTSLCEGEARCSVDVRKVNKKVTVRGDARIVEENMSIVKVRSKLLSFRRCK